jgi:hypothetical protein
MSNQNVIKASEIIIEYMYRNEEKSFMDVMKDGDNKLTTLYRLQHHVFHSVLMLKFNGDETKFNEWFDEFCDDNGICEIYDDELEDEEECCNCREFGDDGCTCDCHSVDPDYYDESPCPCEYCGKIHPFSECEEEEWNNKHQYVDRDFSISGNCKNCDSKCETIDDTLCHYCYHHSLENIEDCWCYEC